MFYYESKGSADTWTADTIEANSKADAAIYLDQAYGVIRDENGTQLNKGTVQYRFITQEKYEAYIASLPEDEGIPE